MSHCRVNVDSVSGRIFKKYICGECTEIHHDLQAFTQHVVSHSDSRQSSTRNNESQQQQQNGFYITVKTEEGKLLLAVLYTASGHDLSLQSISHVKL